LIRSACELVFDGDFWEVEPEHQDYLERYRDGYTCYYLRPDWKRPNRAA
jgi:peptide methionine sulfoxide reductase MsrA